MSYWTLIQVIFDLFVFAALVATWWRLRRPPQDDPRLSRGLQLLQTKITVLEDLSDRTDAQVKQLTTLIDQKTRLLQNKVIEAEQQIIKIEHTATQTQANASPVITSESEVPTYEMLERQRTVAYVKAAKMANAGSSVEQIAGEVNLPREQIELIAKFNREQLMFDETQLPEWAQKDAAPFTLRNIDFVGNLEHKPAVDLQPMARIENNFKQAVNEVKRADEAAMQSILETRVAESIKVSMANGLATLQSGMETMQPAVMTVKATAQTFKEKLVATAEDMLKQQNQNMSALATMQAAAIAAQQVPPPAANSTTGVGAGAGASYTSEISPSTPKPMTINLDSRPVGPSTIIKSESTPKVKKVIFPRIERS